MRVATPINHFMHISLQPPFAKTVVRTSGNICAELIASIRLYSDVKDIGKEILKKNGHANPSKILPIFQSYIKQATTFYEAAETLHYRASPLIYYYSFMNFAKAYICLRDPSFVDAGLMHGLQAERKAIGALKKHYLTVKGDGVFPRFAKQISKSPIASGAKLRMLDLLSYVQQVGFEYQQLEFGDPRIFPVKYFLCANADRSVWHALLMISHYNSKHFIDVAKNLGKGFEQVEATGVFNFQSMTREFNQLKPHYVFFESKKRARSTAKSSAIDQLQQDSMLHLEEYIFPDPYSNNTPFHIFGHILTPRKVYMNDLLAIYCCIYYFGSLVRYRPQILEAMLSTKDAWMIERFIDQAPITFLRQIRNLIAGTNFAYEGT